MQFSKKKSEGEKYLIEVGGNYFRFFLISEQTDQFKIKDFKNIYIEKGVEDPEYWNIFEQEFKKFFRPEVKKANFLISPPHTISCAKLLPPIPVKEAHNYCNQVITHEMGISSLSYYIDHRINRLEGRDNVAGMFSAIKKEILDKIINVCIELQVEVERIDTSLISAETLFSRLGLIPQQASTMAIRMEESFTELFMLKERFVVSYNVLNFGLRDIKFSLVRTIYTHTQPVEINFEKAEKIVNTLGYPEGDGDYSGISYHQLRILLLPALEILAERVKSFIQEYKKEYPSENVSNLYLMGKAKTVPGLGKYLEERISIPHLNFEAPKLISQVAIEEGLEIDQAFLDLVLALTLPEWKKYNYLPPYYRIIKESHRLRNKILIVLIITIMLFSFLYGGVKLNYYYLNGMYRKAEEVYNELYPLIQNVDEVEKLSKKIKNSREAINKVYSAYPDWIGILKELSNITPQEIVLERLESGEEKGKIYMLLEGDIVTGIGSLNLVLNQFIQILGNSPYIQEVRILTTKQISSEFINQLNFTLKCYLK
jgi:hypothetical protein